MVHWTPRRMLIHSLPQVRSPCAAPSSTFASANRTNRPPTGARAPHGCSAWGHALPVLLAAVRLVENGVWRVQERVLLSSLRSRDHRSGWKRTSGKAQCSRAASPRIIKCANDNARLSSLSPKLQRVGFWLSQAPYRCMPPAKRCRTRV
jgi:hypothetical protein